MISTRHKFLFIHVPKVAGQSVNFALEQAVYGPTRRFINKAATRLAHDTGWRVSWPFALVNVHPPHLTAQDWSRKLGARVYDNMFKFAFVRNPWDWQVSLYHYILQDPKHHQNALLKSLGSFGQYLEWRVTDALELQKSYLTDNTGRFLVNFVGRYERLATDFQHVCRVLNLQGVRLPHVNASSHRDFRTYYNARTRKLVEEHFRDDIATFGYTFDMESPLGTDWCKVEDNANLALGI